jgi:hypothetical protein
MFIRNINDLEVAAAITLELGRSPQPTPQINTSTKTLTPTSVFSEAGSELNSLTPHLKICFMFLRLLWEEATADPQVREAAQGISWLNLTLTKIGLASFNVKERYPWMSNTSSHSSLPMMLKT